LPRSLVQSDPRWALSKRRAVCRPHNCALDKCLKPFPQSTIDQYTIVSKIGEGGMGEVWRARDTRLNRPVAIKILPVALSADKDRLARFEQEAQAAGALNHPHILVIFHIGTHDNAPYIVSELLEGEELRDRLNQGPMPLRRVIDFAKQIVDGLCAAHEKGIVHRDLKPENLFITKDERVKILDFGIAKLSAPQSTDPGYFGRRHAQSSHQPRRGDGHRGLHVARAGPREKADHRSDIFSFGAILHEMISGRRAFKRDTMAETMTAILKEEPEELTASNPHISPALARIVNRCLEKKPERRFQSTADLGFALDALSAPTSSSGRELTTAAGVAVAGNEEVGVAGANSLDRRGCFCDRHRSAGRRVFQRRHEWQWANEVGF
jgi:serine/threonine protein kinase